MTATTGATTAVKSIGRRMENILPNKNSNVDTNDNCIHGSNKQQQQPSPDKTASLDDDLECSYDDNNDEGGEDDRDSPSQSLTRKKRQTTTTLAHKLLRGSGVRKSSMNQSNSNINNINDDIIAAAALANADKALAAQQQQPQLSSSPRAIPSNNSSSSSEFGLSFNNILCNRNPSSGTIISDLSASLSPTLSRESWIAGLQQNQQHQQQQQQFQQQQRQYEAEQCFGVGGGCSNRHVHKMTRSSSFDDTGTYTAQSSRYNYNHHHNRERANSSTTGGGEGILIKAMKSCAVFRDFDTILGGNGVGGEDDDDIPPPPPPRSNNGGGYQRPAIWGVAPDANDTFDEESYVSATAAGGGGYTHRPFSIAQRNTTKDDGEIMMKTEKDDDEEEEYDNVELILDESKMQVSSPPRNKNSRRSKSSPQRGSKKSSMMKKSSNPMLMRMLLGGRNNNNNIIIPTNVDDNSPPPPVTIVHHDDKKNMSVGTTPTNDVVDHIAHNDKSTNAPSPSPTSALDIAAVLQNQKCTTTTIEESKELKKTRSRQGRRQRRHSQKTKEEEEEKKNKPRAIVASTPPPASTDSDPIVILHDVATPDRQQQLQVDVKTVTRGGETKTTPVNDDDEQVLDELARRPDPPEVCTPVQQQQQEDLLNKTLEEEFEIDDLVLSTNNTSTGMKDKKTFKSSAIMLRSMKKGIHNFKLAAAPKSKATTTTTAASTTAVISDKDIKNAKHWNAVYDRSSEKYYYYHKITREVSWDKPVGYDEANNNNNNSSGGSGVDTTNSTTKKRSGIVGLVGKKAVVGSITKQGDDDTGNPDVKYWREAVDKSTNEVYYYNSKTKEVSWTRPTCLNDKGDKTSDDDVNVKVERSVSPVQIMKNIIGKNVKAVDMKDPIEENATVVVGDTTERSNQFLTPGDNNLATLAVEVVANNSNTTDDDVRHWREATDATTGKTYYFHKLTKVVTWVKPAELKDAAQEGVTAAVAATKQQTFLADDLSEEVEEDVEKVVPNEHDESNYVPPFDEDEAPFDEQPQQGGRLNKSSSSVKKVVTVTPSQFEDDDGGGEQHDTFDQFSPMPNSGRSNKSMSDQLSRQRTYISHATTKSDSTKKVTNTVHNIHPSSSSTQYNRNISDAATFDSSINSNSSNIASEITAVVGSKLTNTRGGVHKEEENDIPHIPNTTSRVVVAGQQAPPRMSAKTSSKGTSNLIKSITAVTSAAKAGGGGGDSNRKYMSKRAENLGDSSSTNSEKDDDDELWSEDDDIDDSVSALSGIGNDSIKNTKKKKNTMTMKKRTSSSCKKTNDQSKHLPSSDSVNKWTQEELDLFISKNDWGSVAEYINEIRASKQGDITNNRNRSNNSRNKQSTIHEVEERKKNVISPAEETESMWQSLSSDDEK